MIICHVESTEAFLSALRQVPLKGDPSVRPYERADLSVEHVRLKNITPLSKYVLEDQLRILRSLWTDLAALGIDIFALTGRVTYLDADGKGVVAPPIVEVWENEGALLVDGLHRTWLAREEGRETVSATVIRNVKVPLVPLPTTWQAVKTFPEGSRPTPEQKRDYRFESPDAVRSAIPKSADKVTSSNYRYFLYRMLHMTGSGGIRLPADGATGSGDKGE